MTRSLTLPDQPAPPGGPAVGRAGGGVSSGAAPTLEDVLDDATAWFAEEQEAGTLLGEETLWREAYARHLAVADTLDSTGTCAPRRTWASLALRLVFECPRSPVHHAAAASEAVDFLRDQRELPFADQARAVHRIADLRLVERAKVRALLEPGMGYPFVFPRSLWTADVVGRNLQAIVSSLDWERGGEPEAEWLSGDALALVPEAFLHALAERAPEGSDLQRSFRAAESLVGDMEHDGRDVCASEPHAFVDSLQQHGLSAGDAGRLRGDLFTIRECVVLFTSYQLHQRAERCYVESHRVRDDDPLGALDLLKRAANLYNRLAVAQMYPERVLERYQEISREAEALRAERHLDDGRFDHLLLISTFNSPGDLRRLVLSAAHELMAFGYGRRVHLVVSDDSTDEVRAENARVLQEGRRAGLSISHWTSERKQRFFDELNAELYPDASFDVRDLLGGRKPGEKGIPYGRFRNFLRLAALHDMRELGLEGPVSTWLDQDNEIGALVLTRTGTLSKRHVFHYFDEKSRIFADPDVVVGGGGYTNDALEGVEKFWVAWGILGQAFELAQADTPDAPPRIASDTDITRFRPWDQPETLERLPREGEELAHG